MTSSHPDRKPRQPVGVLHFCPVNGAAEGAAEGAAAGEVATVSPSQPVHSVARWRPRAAFRLTAFGPRRSARWHGLMFRSLQVRAAGCWPPVRQLSTYVRPGGRLPQPAAQLLRDKPAPALAERPRGSATRRRTWRLLGALVTLAVLGCEPGPETFVARFDAAVASGDLAQVLPMLTADSRSLVQALQTGGAKPFALPAKVGPTQVVERRRVQRGLLLRVRSGERTASWILVQEGGGWRLDLLATASRRAFP